MTANPTPGGTMTEGLSATVPPLSAARAAMGCDSIDACVFTGPHRLAGWGPSYNPGRQLIFVCCADDGRGYCRRAIGGRWAEFLPGSGVRLKSTVPASAGGDGRRTRLTVSDKDIAVKRQKARAVIPTLDADTWPQVNWADIENAPFEIPADELARVAKFGGKAIEEAEAYANRIGFFIDGTGDYPVAVTTNGHAMAVSPLTLASGRLPAIAKAIPEDTFMLAAKAGKGKTLEVHMDDEQILIRWDGGELRSKVPSDPYPPWRRMLEQHESISALQCDLAELSTAIERVVASSGGSMLGFRVKESRLAIRCRESATHPDATDEIRCLSDGAEHTFGMAADLARSAVKAFIGEGRETIDLSLTKTRTGHASAVIFRSPTSPEGEQWFVGQLTPRFYPEEF